ncbi:MAG: impact-like protein [Piptocephalis tieghemiana]|nr:MAG: impact-like protein [Piptocephalis tieghemiana]
MSQQDTIQRQQDELESLEAIYTSDELQILSREQPFVLQVQVKAGPGRALIARFHLPHSYPVSSPPIYEVQPAPWIPESWGDDIAMGLEEAWSPDNECLYTVIDWLRSFVQDNCPSLPEPPSTSTAGGSTPNATQDKPISDSSSPQITSQAQIGISKEELRAKEERDLGVVHGPELVDRRSSFIAHLAPVHSIADVKRVHDHVVTERRVAKATHNIYAYRIQQSNGQILQDQEDDGETAAGGRLLHVMQMLGVVDVLVIVSRWYGGIMLGPDRFKHICNVGRALLDAQGYIKDAKKRAGPTSKDTTESKKGKKKGR